MPPPAKIGWYFQPCNLVISFLCVGPLMLPLIWWHPKMTRARKIALTVVVLVASLILTWLLVWGGQQLKAYYDMINQLTNQ